MRKFVLIAALVLASASAQAAGMRGLTLASSDDQPAATTEQPKAVEAIKPIETPSAVEDAKPVENSEICRPARRREHRHGSADGRRCQAGYRPRAEGRATQTPARLDRGAHHRHGIYW